MCSAAIFILQSVPSPSCQYTIETRKRETWLTNMTKLALPVNISTFTNRSNIRADTDSPENILMVSHQTSPDNFLTNIYLFSQGFWWQKSLLVCLTPWVIELCNVQIFHISKFHWENLKLFTYCKNFGRGSLKQALEYYGNKD